MSSIAKQSKSRAGKPERPSHHQTRTQRHAGQRQRHRQARQLHVERQKARAARRRLQRAYRRVPPAARSLFDALAAPFTRPTFLRFVVLALATILTLGNRTVSNLLRTLGVLGPGHPSSYHRFFSKRRWSSWGLARRLATWVFDHLVPTGKVLLAGDDTVDEHPGDKVFGKGCHRDPVRSTHSFTAFRWGHKWVVLAVLVKFPFSRRRWALPLLVALYRSKKDDEKHGRKHKTPQDLLRQLCCVFRRWFRGRSFVLTGDGSFGTHELARFAARQGSWLTLVSPFYPNANLYEPPPEVKPGKRGPGRPRVRGKKRPTPEEVVSKAERKRLKVSWYGGGKREVEVVSGKGQWYKAGEGLVEVKWVYVHDVTGTHRDTYLFTTGVRLGVKRIIETYTTRWSLETTFQEMRSYIGLETTRGWKEKTVLRAAPCLFGMYTVVACLYGLLPAEYARVRAVKWPGKKNVTFSDAITAVRRWLWIEWVFATPAYSQAFQKLGRSFRSLLLHALAPAA